MATLGLFAVLFLILTITATAAVVLSSNSPSQSGLSTPEATVQGWTNALLAGDYGKADTYLGSDLKSSGITSQQLTHYSAITHVSILYVSAVGTRATAQVSLTTSGSAGSLSLTLSLVQEDGGWKISGALGAY
jgi:hypothetical protein